MAQDIDTPTTIPLTRKGRPVVLPAVLLAHQVLIGKLAVEIPHVIQDYGYEADRFDILDRRDHLKIVLAAVYDYAKAVVHDTNYFSPITIHDETGGLYDASVDVWHAFENTCDRLIDIQAAE